MAAAAAAAAAAIGISLEDLPDDLLVCVLRCLDGPALAAVGSTSSRLRRLSYLPEIWSDICLSTWPSLRLIPSLISSPSSFFSRAFPFPSSPAATVTDISPPCDIVISLVDLYYRGSLILSRVFETETESPWFRCSPFRLDALYRREVVIIPDQRFSPEDLELSWVIADRTWLRVVDLSSRRPVAVDRHWFSGQVQVRFATLLREGGAVALTTVHCDGEWVKEVTMTVEDMDGVRVCGRDGVVSIGEIMDGGRRGNGRDRGMKEAKEKFGDYVSRKRERKERRVRREGRLQLCWGAAVVSVFSAVFTLLFFR